MASRLTLRILLIDGLKDLHHAEIQLLKALPKISRTATHPQLKAAFISHLAQTREHLERLDQAMVILGVPLKGRTRQSLVDLIQEAIDVVAARAPNAVRDAALIASAQRIKHYEMAGYVSSRGFAQALSEIRVAYLLQTTLAEEGEASKRLITIALTVNIDAAVLEDSEMIPVALEKAPRYTRIKSNVDSFHPLPAAPT